MRVTDLTKQNAIIRNLAKSQEQLQNLQEGMATGRRINKLSDDPIGATKVQDTRTKLSFMSTLQRNIEQNFLWMDRTEAELLHMSDQLQQAKTLILAQANASADRDTRLVTAEELRAITEGLIQSGNARIGKVFIFGGSKTLTPPLERGRRIQPAVVDMDNLGADAQFLLDPEQFAAEFDGFSLNPYVVRITREGPMGFARYQVSDDGGESWSAEKTLLPNIELVNEDGKSSDKVEMRFTAPEQDNLGEPMVFPEGLVYRFDPNPSVKYQGNEDQRLVETSEAKVLPINVTGRQIFFETEAIPDSINIFETLRSLEQALVENDPVVLEQRLAELDQAANQLLTNAANVGSVRREMEQQLDRLGNRELSNTRRLSELEDLDYQQAVVDLNLADVRHKSALDTSGRLVQPSLLNFLK